MFAIAFDLVVADTEKHHPKGVSQAYSDISSTLEQFGFRRIQGSVYVTNSDDMANVPSDPGAKGVALVPRVGTRYSSLPN